jgi:hypothetical protein
VKYAWLMLVALAACDKKSGEPAGWTAPPVMEKVEQERGTRACDAYVARLCVCAEAQPALADQCRLARAQPDALATLLGMVNGAEGKLADRELREAQHAARKIIEDCFEKDAALDPATCPRAR